jgi:predicted alpha/beta hydrolase family esterase
MSKRAIIFHGTDCKPEDYWYQWLGKQLETRGFVVEIPYYPDINHQPIITFLPKVLKSHTFDSDTVIIGHSAGGPLLLSILESIEAVLPQAILVAGYAQEKPGREPSPVLQASYDWERIKQHVEDIVFINSVEDPWGCDAEQGRFMFDKLGGTQIIRNDGHFGSETFKQPYPTFDLLNRIIS